MFIFNTDSIFEKFTEHFNLPNNSRILFTGKFGTGKTTFLTNYFTKNQNEFDVFKLYPVSYSVSQNEDIFELIKYDILFQLLERANNDELTLKNEDYSMLISYQAKFLKTIDLKPILYNIAEYIDKTGSIKLTKTIIEKIKSQYNSFKNKDVDEEKMIMDFLFTQYSKSGNPRERDLISQLISDLLCRLKENTKKENVLIIDDLDRLDPEHIFRLFNIFSVNFGKEETLNKFDFDKIIFVCDLDNIHKIYNHFYGYEVDFAGYIDKFYSKFPFQFNTNEILAKYTEEFVKNLKILKLSFDYNDYSRVRNVLYSILNILVYEKKLNIRTLLNINEIKIDDNRMAFLPYRIRGFITQYPILLILEFIEKCLGSNDAQYNFKGLENYNQYNFSVRKNLFISKSTTEEFEDLMNLSLPFLVDLKEVEEIMEKNNNSESIRMSQTIDGIGNISFKPFLSTIDRSIRFKYNRENIKEIINPFKVLELVKKKKIFSRNLE